MKNKLPTEVKIWESIDAANEVLKCPRPLGGSGGCHWWYVDSDRLEEFDGKDIVPCLCKTCGEKMLLSADAEEYPGV